MNRNFSARYTALIIGLLAVALAMPAVALDRDVSESGPAAADGLVIIENISGSVVVVGWDKAEISVEGTLTGDVEDLEFETGTKKSRIKVIWPKNKKNVDGEADLVINVPRGSELDVECISATVEISGVTGSVEASSISGDLRHLPAYQLSMASKSWSTSRSARQGRAPLR